MYALVCMLIASLVGAALLASPPGPPGAGTIAHEGLDPLIYGGEPVEPGGWPAVVAVSSGKLCTGTLVAPDLILTAAHCFEAESNVPVQIVFGDSLMSGNVISSDSWGSHPDFCIPSDTCKEDLHDFAWVRLDVPIDGIEPIVPITSQVEFDEVMVPGAELLFVGFGRDESGTIGIKRQVSASLTSFNTSGREFRAGGDGNDTCLGDSGGPALVQLASGEWRVAGIISRGGDCGEGGVYGVPLPELCWLRDDSGVDLLPNGCEACDCVDLAPEPVDEGCGCTSGVANERGQLAWAASLAALAGLGLLRRRRRR